MVPTSRISSKQKNKKPDTENNNECINSAYDIESTNL